MQVFGVQKIMAANDEFNIDNEQDLINLVHMSQGYDFEGATINLNSDITITGTYEGNNSLSFNKNSDTPFKGTFNGNGHTIYNLNHHSTINFETCTGLFGYTNGATIKNFTISDSYIGADSLGGAVIGYANNTLIEGVTVYNTTISVKCADNVITLITDGGLVGGGLVGVLENSTMYNCELNNSEVVNNATEAVAALAGKGLYLGGLVGDSRSSTIEYSRVVNNSRVRNVYDVAVGAVGGNTLYVGGIVGELRVGSKVIDSFSTADLYFYCATYVSVGGGNSGHIGGIAGSAYGSSDQIIRSHFAGAASSAQYNAVLVIPIVQRNVNIYGLIDKNNGEHIEKCYYMESTANAVGALGDGRVTDNSGTLTDATYANRDFFESNGYDIVGNIPRNTSYSSSHINKWVMYHDPTNNKTYPIHGVSFMAGFDYPSSASVTILANSYNDVSDTTNSVYKYAVQIASDNDSQTVVVSPNNGYRLYGWYKTVANSTSVNSHAAYDAIFENASPISNSTGYTFNDAQDRDLYLARMQALVNFHDYEGNVIDRSSYNDSETSDNYYFYKETLPDFEPDNHPSDENERFIGWTTVAGSQLSITDNEIEGFIANGQFYEAGDEVIENLDLYPVYASLISNIHLIYEGNELDNNSDLTVRDGYGRAIASIDSDNVATINIVYDYPDLSHYRFLGWYENGYRVSSNEEFVLEDVDLTKEHTYEARFEYLVDYYVKDVYTNSSSYSYKNGALYQSKWHRYNQEVTLIDPPVFLSDNFVEWVLDEYQGSQSAAGHIVKYANENIYSKYSNNSHPGYTGSFTTDFPNSASIALSGNLSGTLSDITFTVNENPNYHFQFWTLDAYGGLTGIDHYIGGDNPHTQRLGSGHSYHYRARMLADVTFNQYDGSSYNVLRAYQENILQDGSGVRSYTYVMRTDAIASSTIENLGGEVNIAASATGLNRDGYYFVGWIDKDAMSSDEIAYVFDIDDYTSSSLNKALPYIITADDLTEKAMPNIYAVYVPYNITTTTNIKEIGVRDPQNLPSDPTYTGIDNSNPSSTVSFTIKDNEEYVLGDSGEKYRLTKFTVSINGDEEIIINSPYTYEVIVGNSYVFKAYYEPLIVNFHVNYGSIITFVRNSGETINMDDEVMPIPEFDVNGLFVGYCEMIPDGEYHYVSDQGELGNHTIINGTSVVYHSMDLYPVYLSININVNSNIDAYLESQGIALNSVRTIENHLDYVNIIAVEEVDNYVFAGWYKNYVDDSNLGELVSEDENVVIYADEAIENELYTAVYKATVSINYHSFDDNRTIIYSTRVISGTRSFIEEVHYIDPSTGQEVSDEGVVDGQAFELIMNQVGDNQRFIEWVYLNNNGEYVRWNDFAYDTIISNMNLYPVLVEARALETPLYNDNKIYSLDADFIDVTLNTTTVDNDTVYSCIAYFNEEYYEVKEDVSPVNRNEIVPETSIRVSETIYIPDTVYIGKENVDVSLYKQENCELIDSIATDSNGISDFRLYGLLTVSITADDDNDDFIIIVERSNGEDYVNYLRFSLKDEESKTLILPYGDYAVRVDNNYSWRYANASQVEDLIISNLRDAQASFTFSKTNNKWFDFSERKVNKYE